MARPISGIEIYLPLTYNDGRLIPEAKYVSIQRALLSRFGGVTSTQRQFAVRATRSTCRPAKRRGPINT
jgi:hypothetical protein